MQKVRGIYFSIWGGILTLFSQPSLSHGTLSYAYRGGTNKSLHSNGKNQFIELELGDRREVSRWDGVYNFSFRHYGGAKETIYSLSEFYLSRRVGDNQYFLGRKIIPWQKNGKFWAMGELNPLRGFNLLETKREGRSGFFYERRKGPWFFMVQLSPFNIPQVNPALRVREGKVEGSNEWAYLPPEYVRYRNHRVPLFYTLENPKLRQILLRKSASLLFRYSFSHTSLGGYLGYSPEPNIRVNATGYYEQEEFGEERAVVRAKPFLHNHFFWGGSWDQEIYDSQLKFSLGLEGVIPEGGGGESFEFEALKIRPTYERVSYATFSFGHESENLKLKGNILYLMDGDSFSKEAFAKKPKWRRALGGEFSWTFQERFSLNSLYKYDLKTQDMTFLASLSYRFSKHFSFLIGGQLMDSPREDSFWSSYRANDLFYSQVSLLFPP